MEGSGISGGANANNSRAVKKFKGNEFAIPIYTPRSAYNFIRQNDELLLNDLTLNFDPLTIKVLKAEFVERQDEIKIHDFIMIIKDHLINWQLDISNREKKLIRSLYLLFNDIDINGNGNMEWDEFTSYIIKKAAVLNTMKNKNEEIKPYNLTDMRLKMKAIKSDETKSFQTNDTNSKNKLKQVIAKMIYIDYIKKLAFFEEESDIVQFADPETGEIEPSLSLHVKVTQTAKRDDGINSPECNAERAMLLDILFINDPKYNLLMTSSNDGFVRMFKYGNKGFVPADDSNQRDNELNLKHAQVLIVWDYVNEILYSGQRDGVIRIWEQKSEPQYKILGKKRPLKKASNKDDESKLAHQNTMLSSSHLQDKKKTAVRSRVELSGADLSKNKLNEGSVGVGTSHKEKREGHDNVVTAMLPLPKLQFLASASLDKKIILWDLLENVPKREYKGYHKRGIIALDFSEPLILLISGGFDHEIYVWNPYIDSPVHNLSSHAAPIVGLAFLPNPLHIVSVDSDCTMKVWDTKKFKCVESPTIDNMDDKQSFKIQGICITTNPLKVIMVGKNIYTFSYDKNNNLTSADENVSLCARFVPASLCLMTPVGNKVKLWNMLTGEIKKIFSEVCKSDICALILDNKGKRFIVGDMDGNVGVYNVINGALLKSLSKHKAEIVSLIHAVSKTKDDLEFVITASVDNVIRVHDDKDLLESKVMSEVQIKDGNITSMVYEKELGKILIGKSNGVITLYETSTGKNNEEFSDKDPNSGPESEITTIAFFNGLNSLVFTNSAAKIKIAALPPLQIKHEILYRTTNYSVDGVTQASVGHMIYCGEKKRLFLADEKFNLKCLDISKVISHIESVAKMNDKAKRVFNINDSMIKIVFNYRAHDETIRSLEYIARECLLVTTSLDRNVKIWSSETANEGKPIESLKQSKTGNKIKPIAYKKVESNEIYTPRMEDRIDEPYVTAKHKRDNLVKEYNQKQEQGLVVDKISDEIKIENAEIPLKAFEEYQSQEFDPSYYTRRRIHSACLENKRSNEWNLRIGFEKYHREFEECISKTITDIKHREELLFRQKEEEEANPKAAKQPVVVLAKSRNFIPFKEKYISATEKEENELRLQLENENKKKKKKATNKTYEKLYTMGLKQIILRDIVNNRDKPKLSESERMASLQFAKALSNIDEKEKDEKEKRDEKRRKDEDELKDPRVLRFTEFEPRKEKPLYLPSIKKPSKK